MFPNIKNLLRSTACVISLVFSSATAFAAITDGKFGEAQIFDVQWNLSGNTLNASSFIAPYASNGQHPTVVSGDYYQFFPSTTNLGTYGLALYHANGTLSQVLHDTGSFTATGPDAVFYLGSGSFGTLITTSTGFSYGQSGAFTNMNLSPNAGALASYTWASTSPLGPGVTAPTSPNALNTALSFIANQNALRSLLSQRSSAMMGMMDYDCDTFDAKGYCVSFRARYTAMDSQNEGAGVFTVAYRASAEVRIGGFIDYRATEKASAGLKQGDATPTFGAFAVYSDRGDATGFQGKVSAAYNSGKVTVTRVGSDADNTEPGAGKAGLSSYAFGATLSWGFAVAPAMLITPYAGIRYSDATRKAYTEGTVAGVVDYPISYDAYFQRLTTATAGVRFSGMFNDQFGYQVSVGGENDLAHKFSAYSGTSTIPGLETFAIVNTGSSNHIRVVASTGVSFQMDKTQRLTANVSARGQAYSSQPAVTILVGYQLAY